MTKSVRLAGMTVLSLSLLGLTGCPDKKPEAAPEPKPAEVKPPPPPPAPPAAPEPRAEKECAAPIDPGPTQELKIGERAARLSGARLTFPDKDADGKLVIGVLGPVDEDSGANMLALQRYLKFFAEEKADAIVVTGDVGELAPGITRVMKELGASKLPVLVVVGNRECKAEFTDGVAAAQKDAPNIINLNQVRVVEFPELTLVSLPGYHAPEYINCKTGCQYFKSTLDEVMRVAKDAKSPVALVAHGPPRGEGSQALDFAGSGGNVGDEAITKAITATKIAFGLFSNIKEAGGRASKDPAGQVLLKEGEVSESLYLNPGPADTVGWEMNDGTKGVGMAATLTVKGGKGSYKLFRMKPLTAAEKAEAKKLEPVAEKK